MHSVEANPGRQIDSNWTRLQTLRMAVRSKLSVSGRGDNPQSFVVYILSVYLRTDNPSNSLLWKTPTLQVYSVSRMITVNPSPGRCNTVNPPRVHSTHTPAQPRQRAWEHRQHKRNVTHCWRECCLLHRSCDIIEMCVNFVFQEEKLNYIPGWFLNISYSRPQFNL